MDWVVDEVVISGEGKLGMEWLIALWVLTMVRWAEMDGMDGWMDGSCGFGLVGRGLFMYVRTGGFEEVGGAMVLIFMVCLFQNR